MFKRLTLCCALFASLLLAQFDTAQVLGTVLDGTGAAVSDSDVTLTNVLTGVQQKSKTDASGNYQFANVKAGEYKLESTAKGFKSAVANNFTVTVNARQRVDLKLYGFYIGELKAPSAQVDATIRVTKFLSITPSYLYYSVPASGLNELANVSRGFTRNLEEHQFRIDGTVVFSFHKFEISERNMYVRRFLPTYMYGGKSLPEKEINRYRNRIAIAYPLAAGSHIWKPFASYEALRDHTASYQTSWMETPQFRQLIQSQRAGTVTAAVIGVAGALLCRRALELLSLGDDAAQAMGLRLGFWKPLFLVLAVCPVAGVTPVAGPIAFVGLAVPHIVRLLKPPGTAWAILLNVAFGGFILVTADMIASVA